MDADEPTYDLKTLCDLAGVTVRTVRFYIQQGLLPSPGLGAGARYTQDHLERLHLIRQLQRAHLPLAEIRRRLPERLNALPQEEEPDAAMLPMIAEPSFSFGRVPPDGAGGGPRMSLAAPPAVQEGTPRRSASEYIRDVLEQRQLHLSPRSPYPTKPTQPKPPQRSQWERIEIADDVELHVRRPLTRDANRRLDRLLQAARHIFEEEP